MTLLLCLLGVIDDLLCILRYLGHVSCFFFHVFDVHIAFTHQVSTQNCCCPLSLSISEPHMLLEMRTRFALVYLFHNLTTMFNWYASYQYPLFLF